MKTSFRDFFLTWLKIGCLNFGGPAGQIALMHRILVEDRKWISEKKFLHALNFCMLLPGPEAQQLATYIGWLQRGISGGLISGLLFIIPGALVVFGLTLLYVFFQETWFLQAVFVGIKASVLAIVIQATLRLGKKVLRAPPYIVIAVLSFLAVYLFRLPFPLIIALAGIGGSFIKDDALADEKAASLPSKASIFASFKVALALLALWAMPLLLILALKGPRSVFADIFFFFSKLAVVTFGGAYAVLTYMAQQAVEHYAWLSPGEMVDGLGLAETTPGPLILVTQFVGFLAAWRQPGGLDPLLAGTLGALLVLWVTFTPCFLWIFLGAPWMERLQQNRRLNAALKGITAAIVGVIAQLALWFGIHTLFGEVAKASFAGAEVPAPIFFSLDIPALGLFAFSGVALFALRIPILYLIGLMALLGGGLHYISSLLTIYDSLFR